MLLLTARGEGGAIGVPGQVFLSLALATLVIYLVLVWRLRVDGAAPIVDIVVMTLILTAYLAGQPPELEPVRLQRGASRQILWVLLSVGAGGVMVAGSTGLALGLRAALRTRIPNLAWPQWLDLHLLLKEATFLSLVVLGAGLAVSAWWAWEAGGTVAIASGALTFGSNGDGLLWVAITWLVAAMSHVARRIGKKWGRWTAGLAIAMAVTGLVGLWMLAAPANLP
jgi:hypothetical protein